jgi:hypothetical protein
MTPQDVGRHHPQGQQQRLYHEATLSHGGQEIGTFRREISRDGKQMTVTLRRRTPPADNVEVYEKVFNDQ